MRWSLCLLWFCFFFPYWLFVLNLGFRFIEILHWMNLLKSPSFKHVYIYIYICIHVKLCVFFVGFCYFAMSVWVQLKCMCVWICENAEHASLLLFVAVRAWNAMSLLSFRLLFIKIDVNVCVLICRTFFFSLTLVVDHHRRRPGYVSSTF